MAKALQGPHEPLLLCEAVLGNRILATCPHKCPRRGGAGPSGSRHRDPCLAPPSLPSTSPPSVTQFSNHFQPVLLSLPGPTWQLKHWQGGR